MTSFFRGFKLARWNNCSRWNIIWEIFLSLPVKHTQHLPSSVYWLWLLLLSGTHSSVLCGKPHPSVTPSKIRQILRIFCKHHLTQLWFLLPQQWNTDDLVYAFEKEQQGTFHPDWNICHHALTGEAISPSFLLSPSLSLWQMCAVLRLHKQRYMTHQVKIYSFHYLAPLVS